MELEPLLVAEDIAKILRVNPRKVSEHYAMQPDFPKPIRLPSAKGQGRYRWKASEIAEWIERLRDG